MPLMKRMPVKAPSESLTEEDAALIKTLLALGHPHKRIAALFDCNQGRISEISTGTIFRMILSLHEQIRIHGVEKTIRVQYSH